MDHLLTRRALLSGILPFIFVAGRRLPLDAASQETAYRLEVGILFGLISYEIKGRVIEEIDRAAERYRVRIDGDGTGISTHMDVSGIIRGGRFVPVRTRNAQTLRGRENRLAIDYDYERGRIEYHSVGYTFFLGRRRQVDDTVAIPKDGPIDDAVSACLNFAADRLERAPDGSYRTRVVRRSRPENEGPDDVSPDGYRIEIVPFAFKTEEEPGTGRLHAKIDLTRWSTWARSSKPAVLTFRRDRRIESVDSPMILGSRAMLRLG